jgi:CheY-like chemotaxis protein
MGGQISVESTPGKGSTFSFTVGLGLQRYPTPKAYSAAVASLRDLVVLVVDDNRINRCVVTEMLTGWHMKPVTAAGAEQALVALQEADSAGIPCSLVLIDAQMPHIDGFALASRIKQDPKFSNIPMIMLISSGASGDGSLCRQLGIGAYLTKPINQSDLLDSIRLTLGTSSLGADLAPPLVHRDTLENRNPLRILVADDNVVNQRVAQRLLQRAGYGVVLASDGKEAVDLLEREVFDLVLMDVQMPKLNGYEATAVIREREKTTGLHVPIIALTAHAMMGDREACLAAGMDGYVSKPIQPETLFKTIKAMARPRSVESKPDGGS